MECKLLKYIKYSQEFKINFYKNIKQFRKKIEEKIPPQKAKKCNVIIFKIASENYNSF
jgi:hypothetical protein